MQNPHQFQNTCSLLHWRGLYVVRLNKLPDNITELEFLRYLALIGFNVDNVPRGFGGLRNLTPIQWFPAKMDGDWCSLEELGPLYHLRDLSIRYLENVPDSSIAARVVMSNKKHLTYLEELGCYRDEEEKEEGEKHVAEEEEEEEEREEQSAEEEEEEGEEQSAEEEEEEEEGEEQSAAEEEEEQEEDEGEEQTVEEEQQRIETVFDELCPPPCLEQLTVRRYFGRRLPNWMQASVAASFKSLRIVLLYGLIYCNQLPNGLCGMLNLEVMEINVAPAIKLVGADFQSLASRDGGAIVTIPFPKLRVLFMSDLSRWKKWDWDEEQDKARAMPALENLTIANCRLTHLPSGLASHNRYNLRTLNLYGLTVLACVENFPSVVCFDVLYCPKLKKIGGFSKLRKISINGCPKLKLLEGFPVLSTMVLDDEPWKITGTPAECTPKVYEVGRQRQLPENFTVTREKALTSEDEGLACPRA